MIINYEGRIYDCDDKLSFKDFTGWDFRDRPEYDLKNKIIYSSCFLKEIPDTKIFNPTMTGTTFIKCNLSNIIIPDGNTVIDCITTRFKVQNDLRDWEIDDVGIPTRVLSKKYWNTVGISVEPDDIPNEKVVLPLGKSLEDYLREIIPEVNP